MADTKPESKPADDLGPLKWLRQQMGSETGGNPKGFGNKQEDQQLKQLDEEPAAPAAKPDQSSHAGHVHNAIDFLQQALVKTGSHTPDGLIILDALRSLGKHFGEKKVAAAMDPALANVMKGHAA